MRNNKEISGSYVLPATDTSTRKRKIDPDRLREIVDKEPDLFIHEIAEKFNVSAVAIHKLLQKMKITFKKRHSHIRKNPKKRSEHLEKLETIPAHMRVYVYESGIHKYLFRESGRAIRGAKIQNVKKGRKFRKTNVIAARRRDVFGKLVYIAPLCFNHTANSAFFTE